MQRKKIKEACDFGGIWSFNDVPDPRWFENLKKNAEELNRNKPIWKVIKNPFTQFKIVSNFTHLIGVQQNKEEGKYGTLISFYFINFE